MSKPRYRLRMDGRAQIVDSWVTAECGQRLREERKRLGLSQAAVAGLVGVTREQIGFYERGAAPNANVLLRLIWTNFDVLYILVGERTIREHSISAQENKLTLSVPVAALHLPAISVAKDAAA